MSHRCLPGFHKDEQVDKLKYVLGYGGLFASAAPDLVQMLILVMATRNPVQAVEATVNRMEGLFG